jgi:branched-subunit amino acid aminotransferase/4-amino-4-deoxychorismate lyase
MVATSNEVAKNCSETAIAADALRDADELMLLGTTTEVMPVIQVDDWAVSMTTLVPVRRVKWYSLRWTVYVLVG